MRIPFLLLSVAILSMSLVGCEKPSTAGGSGANSEALANADNDHGHSHDGDEHGHDEAGHDDHGHDEHGHEAHIEEMGPNKGHIIRLEPADYVAEWRHYKGNSVIRVYVLDGEKKTTPVNATVTITPEAGKTKDPFELEPEDANDDGATAVYMLDEQQLALAMNLGVTISVEVDGKVYSGKVPPHKPHHH